MIDLWFEIPWWVRAPIACAIIGYGAATVLSGYRAYEVVDANQTKGETFDLAADRRAKNDFEIGFVMTLLGVGVLMISGRSKAEKNGYRSC